jgi:hypothetical protein
MELQPWLFLLLLILGTSLGASLTWFLCHNSSQATRIRHRERTKALLKSFAELEACCAKLEAQAQKLRSSEAGSLRREVELETLLKAEQRSIVDREQLLRESESRILQGFQSASLRILRASEESESENIRPAQGASREKGFSEDQDANSPSTTLREKVVSGMLEDRAAVIPAPSQDTR